MTHAATATTIDRCDRKPAKRLPRSVALALVTLFSLFGLLTLMTPSAMAVLSQDRVIVDAIWNSPVATPGDTVELAVIMDIDPGWHIYPGQGSPDELSGYINTSISLELPDGWTVGEIEWPDAHDFLFGAPGFQEELKVLEGRAIAFLPVTIAEDATAGRNELSVQVAYQACDDTVCEMPTSASATTAIEIVIGDPNDVSDERAEERDRIFADRATTLERTTDSADDTTDIAGAEEPDASTDTPARVAISLEVEDNTLAITMTIQEAWHITPGLGTGGDYFTLPTELRLRLPDGWSHGEIQWPDPHDIEIIGPSGPEFIQAYEGVQTIHVDLEMPGSAEAGRYNLVAELEYQACDPDVCEPPVSAFGALRLDVANKSGSEPSLVSATSIDPASVNTSGSESTANSTDDRARSSDEGQPSGTSTASATTDARPSFFGLTLPTLDGAMGVALLALFSAIGGFVLNLTPCVLPVIPIKIMTIMQHANHRGRTFVLGLWMALGVVVFWIGIGLPVAFISGVTDPSRIFGIWWLTFGIGLLIALMGIGIMGMFTIQLPGAVYAINPKADTAWGSLVFGIMTGVLGLPCFGFVAGALLAGVATMPWQTILIIFASLGIGMALPYLVLSAKPSLVDRLPRTGPASELVKQVMGLLLLAAAAYFVGSGLLALVNEQPYVARKLHLWAAAGFASLAGLWLIIRTFQITRHALPRLSFLVLGLAFGSLATFFAYASTAKAAEEWSIRQAAIAASDGSSYIHGIWNDWSSEAEAKARADGHIVVLDFTAEWCLNCKALKAAVLNREPVKSALKAEDVITFTVDLTNTSAPGWGYLNELGRTGIPLLVMYGPENEQPWQSNAYTSGQVMDALRAARDGKLARK